MPEFREVDIDQILPNPYGELKEHPEYQINQLAALIKEVGFLVPAVLNKDLAALAGTLRIKAAKKNGLKTISAIVVDLPEVKQRMFAVADNKIPENGRWNRQKLGQELVELQELLIEAKIDIDVLGFTTVEIDQIIVDLDDKDDVADEIAPELLTGDHVTQRGDIFQLDRHRVGCGDARDQDFLREMMDGQRAHAGFFDVPYNVSIRDVVGRGRIKYAEFAMASGEMSADEYQVFLRSSMKAAAAVSREDAVHFYCSGYPYLAELMLAGREVYAKLLTMAVWAKTNAGQGSPWRNQHEEVCIYRVGDAPHRDNVQRGKHGRSRSNLWTYAGMNQFGPERMENLHAHPTAKPIRLVMDALKDCTRRGDVVLDSFCGAGATLMACERIGRVAVCLDIEPAFVDTAIRRWQRDTGKNAIHVASGFRFDELAGKAALRIPA